MILRDPVVALFDHMNLGLGPFPIYQQPQFFLKFSTFGAILKVVGIELSPFQLKLLLIEFSLLFESYYVKLMSNDK